MEILLLYDVIIIFGLSIANLFICNLFRVPAIVGFFLTGILVGPYGLGLINALHEVEVLAEIGVVLLLFTIGIEFSFKRMLKIKKSILLGGTVQVLLTILITFLFARQLGQTLGESIFIGFLISLSSTAIVLKLIQERAEVDSPHGSTTLGILIFQDIIIVPMILFTPLLAGATEKMGESAFLLVFKGIGIIVLVVVCTKWIVPQILYQIARTRSQELFLLSIVTICLGIALTTSSAGLSLALGAFLAGLIISESEYSHRALGNILPFRDVFTTFFFVSIGMLFDFGFLFRNPLTIALIALGILTLKSMIAGIATLVLGFPLRTSIFVGLALGQVGEFSFVLSRSGIEHGLMGGDRYQIFLAGSVLSMAATPFIIALAPQIADLILRFPFPKKLLLGFSPVSKRKVENRRNHLIIIGFGVSGRHLARAAKVAKIPYLIIEMNPETVRSEQDQGEPIYYGDSTQAAVLEHAQIKYARIVVVAINDPTATRRITEIIRRVNPKVYLIVRTHYLEEMKHLYKLGSDEVIPEEFETSVEIFTRVLTKYLVPRNEILRLVTAARADGYHMFRSLSKIATSFSDLKLQDIDIITLSVGEGAFLIDKSLVQSELRGRYGITLLAIRRDAKIISNPKGDTKFCAGDVLFVLGDPDKVAKVASFAALLHRA